MPHADPEKAKKYRKDYYQNRKEDIKKKRRDYVASNPEKVSTYNQQYFKNHPGAFVIAERKSRRKLKEDAVARLGGKCVCCGEKEMEFLTVDHVNGGGKKHREDLKKAGKSPTQAIYRELRDAADVSMYRLLCWNCNSSAHFGNGICVHQRKN